jgi:putative ABC transport system permease protein
VAFFRSPDDGFNYLALRCSEGGIERAETSMRQAWDRMYSDTPFSYFRQAQVFESFHRSFQNVATVFAYLAGLALVIACLGLVGLAAQNYARRLKEVSIRKVLGATVGSITFVANRTFLTILLVAGTIATGACFAAIQLLLEEARSFTGAMELGATPYLLADLIVLLTAATAISVQTWRLSKISPSEALRNE